MTVARSPLSDHNRQFLRGEIDVDDEQNYEYRMRSDARAGIERLPTDLDLLEAGGHGDLVGEFYWKTAPVHRLRTQIKTFEERMMDIYEQGDH